MCIGEEGNIGKCTGGGKVRRDAVTVETREFVISHSFCNYTSRNFKSNNRR